MKIHCCLSVRNKNLSCPTAKARFNPRGSDTGVVGVLSNLANFRSAVSSSCRVLTVVLCWNEPKNVFGFWGKHIQKQVLKIFLE